MRLVKRSLPLSWDALKQGDAIAGVLTSVFGVAGLSWVLQFIPWWVPVGAFGLLFLYGLLKANFEQFQQIERKLDEERRANEALKEKLTTTERRKALKKALSSAADEGERLHIAMPTVEQAEAWAGRVRLMIALALDTGEMRLFDREYGATTVNSQTNRKDKRYIRRRLQHLHELIPRVELLDVNPDFVASDWIATRPVRIVISPQAKEVVVRIGEIQAARLQQEANEATKRQ